MAEAAEVRTEQATDAAVAPPGGAGDAQGEPEWGSEEWQEAQANAYAEREGIRAGVPGEPADKPAAGAEDAPAAAEGGEVAGEAQAADAAPQPDEALPAEGDEQPDDGAVDADTQADVNRFLASVRAKFEAGKAARPALPEVKIDYSDKPDFSDETKYPEEADAQKAQDDYYARKTQEAVEARAQAVQAQAAQEADADKAFDVVEGAIKAAGLRESDFQAGFQHAFSQRPAYWTADAPDAELPINLLTRVVDQERTVHRSLGGSADGMDSPSDVLAAVVKDKDFATALTNLLPNTLEGGMLMRAVARRGDTVKTARALVADPKAVEDLTAPSGVNSQAQLDHHVRFLGERLGEFMSRSGVGTKAKDAEKPAEAGGVSAPAAAAPSPSPSPRPARPASAPTRAQSVPTPRGGGGGSRSEPEVDSEEWQQQLADRYMERQQETATGWMTIR